MSHDQQQEYRNPEIRDLGTLTELTLAGQIEGFEDAGPKFSILDVSGGVLPI